MTVVRLVDETISKKIRARLNLAIDTHDEIPKNHGRTAAVAALLGEGHQTVRLWLSDGKTKKAGLPNLSRIASIAKKLEVNIEWLLEGTGPMLRKDTDDKDVVSAELLGEMWFIAQKQLMDIDINALDRELKGIVLLHIYEMASLYGYQSDSATTKERAKVIKFGAKGARNLIEIYNRS